MTSYDEENAAAEDVGDSLKALKAATRLGAGVGKPLSEASDKDPLLARTRGSRYFYLDATRIACVICVAIDHGAPQFGKWNVIFTQNWVLQLLFIVSGASFALSQQGISGYVGRLFSYFFLGVMINLTAWSLANKDWRHNLFEVIYQFWFIAGIIIYSLLLHPLKPFLRKARKAAIKEYGADDPDFIFDIPAISAGGAQPADIEPADEPAAEPASASDAEGINSDTATRVWAWPAAAEPAAEPSTEAYRANYRAEWSCYEPLFKALAAVALIVAAIMLLTSMLLEPFCQAYVAPLLAKLMSWTALGETAQWWNLPSNLSEAEKVVGGFCSYAEFSLCSVCIAGFFPMLYKRSSLVGWLMIANMVLNRVIFQRSKDERPFHGFDLFFMSFVIAHLGLRHRMQVAGVVVRYWFIFLIICGLVWIPGTYGRHDIHPPSDAQTRLRVNYLDAFFIVAWLTAGEFLFDKRIFTEDKMDFLNFWALAVFLLHKAIHICFSFPTNWAILVSLLPVCWLWMQRKGAPL